MSSSRRSRGSGSRTNGSFRPSARSTRRAALELMAELAPASVPALIDLDRERFVLVMEEAPAGWRPWKALLLDGVADPVVAQRLGELLRLLHTSTADVDLGSAASFEAQRVDPYLRTVQRRHPDARERDRRLRRAAAHDETSASSTATTRRRTSSSATTAPQRAVGDRLGDRPPGRSRVRRRVPPQPPAAEDDPPAGLAQCYEACGAAFLDAYGQDLDLGYVLGLVGCLMLARVDGKSPAEYLTGRERGTALAASLSLLAEPPNSLREAWTVVTRDLRP